MKLSPQQMSRTAGLGAFAVGASLVGVYALWFWFITPRNVGIDRIESAVCRIAVGLIFVALIAIHIVYGRILLAASENDGTV